MYLHKEAVQPQIGWFRRLYNLELDDLSLFSLGFYNFIYRPQQYLPLEDCQLVWPNHSLLTKWNFFLSFSFLFFFFIKREFHWKTKNIYKTKIKLESTMKLTPYRSRENISKIGSFTVACANFLGTRVVLISNLWEMQFSLIESLILVASIAPLDRQTCLAFHN